MKKLRRVFSSVWISSTLAVALVLVLSLQAWGLQLFGQQFDYQKAASWGQVIAALAASIAIIVTVGSLQADRRRRDADRRRARHNELTQVFAWLEPRVGNDGMRTMLLSFENRTRIPIYEWSIILDEGQQANIDSVSKGPIRPGASSLRLDFLSSADPAAEPRLTFQFVDVDGDRWRRQPTGELLHQPSSGS
jgi:hypothetical protein